MLAVDDGVQSAKCVRPSVTKWSTKRVRAVDHGMQSAKRLLAVDHGVQSAKCVRAFGHHAWSAKRVRAVDRGVQNAKCVLPSITDIGACAGC